MCIVAGPEIVRAPLVVKVPVTSGNPAKSNVAVMVTGTGVGVADAEGAEPTAKQPSTSRIVVNVMFRFFIFNFPFVVLAFFGFPSWEVSSGRSLMYCAKIGRLLRGKVGKRVKAETPRMARM